MFRGFTHEAGIMKIVTVIGARPQFIKAAVVSHALQDHGDVQEILIHTGQHYDVNMSKIFFDELGIPEPHYNLGIGSDSHGMQTARMLQGIEELLCKERPDWLLVYGDTNSTLAGALAGAKLQIPVVHVEAGLRSFNRRMPEEINRIVTDRVSEILFAPTEEAVRNLCQEGMSKEQIHLVGDVMYDATLRFGSKAEKSSSILQSLALNSKEYILVTAHRAETTDSPIRLRNLVQGLCAAARGFPIVWPLHPRMKAALQRLSLLDEMSKATKLIEPLGYLDMVMLEKHARCIATDSGGVQKEAFFHRVPCATLRDETEWVELVHFGWNKLVPPIDAAVVAKGLTDAVTGHGYQCEHAPELYGGGHAAPRIVDILKRTSAQ